MFTGNAKAGILKIIILPSPIKSSPMNNDYREQHKQNYNTMRTVYNVTIGIIIIGIGLLMFFNEKVGLNLSETFEPLMINLFGGLCLLYGGFRLYRGIKKEI